MFKQFITAVATVALITATATQAAATDNRNPDVGQVIGGLALLTIIGLALTEDRRAEPRRDTVVRPVPANGQRLPVQCLIGVPTSHGPVDIYGARCLEQEYRFADRLPARCATTVDGAWGGARRGYDPRCLEINGFRAHN